MADTSKSAPILLFLIAGLAGYMGWSGAGISLLKIDGLQARTQAVKAMRDTIAEYEAKVDTAKRDLAKESVDDLTKRVDNYRASLSVLRTLVPAQREVANLLDDVSTRARVQGLNLSNFTPGPATPGPGPFDTQTYQFTVIGHYNNVGRFLTDIASLRRILVPTEVSLSAANTQTARALGDTTAMLEAHFTVRTYVKAQATGDSTDAQ